MVKNCNPNTFNTSAIYPKKEDCTTHESGRTMLVFGPNERFSKLKPKQLEYWSKD
jgi:hypothetical protein